jgi:hypothetical protein
MTKPSTRAPDPGAVDLEPARAERVGGLDVSAPGLAAARRRVDAARAAMFAQAARVYPSEGWRNTPLAHELDRAAMALRERDLRDRKAGRR